jgi:polysaccharide biosynthesis/export protein
LKIHTLILSVFVLSSCASYKQSILFKVADDTVVKQAALAADKNYVLAKNDVITLRVFTKNGERIIDPDNKLVQGNISAQAQTRNEKDENFLIDNAGVAKLPMLGEVRIEGLTLREVEIMLQKEYLKFYNDVFVTVQCTSHRVVVLGAAGGQVIPLIHENTTLVEVIALSKGFLADGKAKNIRLLRGTEVMVADFSTVEAYHTSNYLVQPGDVVYIEPVRRPGVEVVRDYGPVVSVITSLIALLILATN